MRNFFILFLIAFAGQAFGQNPSQILADALNPNSKKVLVAAHRGDWRETPENSVQALKNSIAKRYDIMELDVKMTKDSILVVMHDNTIDRTTNGKGRVSDFTFSEIQKFSLRNGLGRVTYHKIPTFKEMMGIAKDKIIINVDKGNDHLKEVFKVLQETNTQSQAIVNVGDNIKYKEVQGFNLPKDAILMVVVNMKNSNAMDIIKGYEENPKVVIQPIFDTDTYPSIKELPQIAKKQIVWLNSLWPSLNGGHDDDRAVELNQKEESWGWLLKLKPRILQTDRPEELMKYLQSK